MSRAAEFDWTEYFRRRYPLDAATYSAARRRQTRMDPLLFALTYFGHHLKSPETDQEITFSDFHLDLCDEAKRWADKLGDLECRNAYMGPRGIGKSTWLFLILPMWALAHGHREFCIAFADTATQAETHLKTFKHELDNNALLRFDYPDLCSPALRPDGRTEADDQSLTIRANGAVFVAKGIDSSALGAKVGNKRPDLILFDDIEPAEDSYSPYQKVGRLKTITQAVFPMNLAAVVVFAGTVTMSGSVIHDIVRTCLEAPEVVAEDDDLRWVLDEKITGHHYPALVREPDGGFRSMWPGRWSADFLKSIMHTRSFAMNFQNEPVNPDGLYWTAEDIQYADPSWTDAELPVMGFTRGAMTIDPAVSDGKSSDWSAIAVGSLRPAMASNLPGKRHPLVLVREVTAVKMTGRQLRDYALGLLSRHPGVTRVFVECNQGRSLWLDAFADAPVRVDLVHHSEPKPVRAGMALAHYQAVPTRVLHARRFPSAETQMLGFPRVLHDDEVDAVSHLTRVLLEPETVNIVATLKPKTRRPRVARQYSYQR
jgi:hypothetical protein